MRVKVMLPLQSSSSAVADSGVLPSPPRALGDRPRVWCRGAGSDAGT